MRVVVAALSAAAMLASGTADAAPRDAPVGLVRGLLADGTSVTRLDPRTLRAVGPRLRVADEGAPSVSPDGTRLVLGNGNSISLSFVDVARMRSVGRLVESPHGFVRATSWPAPRRVLAVAGRYRIAPGERSCCLGSVLLVVDPVTRRVLRRVPLGAVQAHARYAGGFVLVSATPFRIGPSRLVVVDAAGRVRSTALARIRSGRDDEQLRTPGLAVDPSGRAFVVGAGDPVAEVDIATLAVSYHAVTPARAVRSGARTAAWLGGGLVAVSGTDWDDSETTPAGASLLDTRTWRTRTLDARAITAVAAGGLVFTLDGIGVLAAFEPGGRERFRIASEPQVWAVQLLGDRVFAGGDDADGYRVLDVRDGRVLETVRGAMPLLVSSLAR